MPLALYALTESMEPAFRDWQKAWGKEPIVPSGCFLEDGEPFEAWLSKRRAPRGPRLCRFSRLVAGEGLLPDGKPRRAPILAMSKPAHGLDAPLYWNSAGHIAYGTRPDFRRRGLAAPVPIP